MDKTELINEWITKAENDLLNVENNLNSKSIPLDTVCYHCQQAAEKYLKAYCVMLDVVFDKSHNLLYLLDIINQKDNSIINDDMYMKCEKINDFSTQTRYPIEDFHEPTLEETKEAYQIALQIKEFVLQKFKGS